MADIVSLIASILQLVDTVAKARGYLVDFFHAPKHQQRLIMEVQFLDPLLRELDRRIQHAQATKPRSVLQNFAVPLGQLKEILQWVTKRLAPKGGLSKATSRLAWPLWGKEEVEKKLRTVERFKSLILSWLELDIWFVISPFARIIYNIVHSH